MFTRRSYVFGIALAVTMCMGLSGAIASDDCYLFGCNNDCKFTTDFRLQECHWFKTIGINPYFKLIPGYQLVLESDEERVEITVLWDTQWIDLRDTEIGKRVRTRVVEEREFEEDTQIEVSRNFFAICQKTNDVVYFGEDVADCDLEERGGFLVNEDGSFDDSRCADGDPPDEEGAWRAGEDDAMPGLIMPGIFLLGSRYFQEIAEEAEAVDRGENVAMGLTVVTPAGTFENCVKVVDTNPAEGICKRKDGDVKKYCPGIGLVKDEDLKLVCYGFHCDE